MKALGIALLLLLSAPVWAQQFYFVGRIAPAGSIDAAGAGTPMVYLRWDTLEGEVPPEITGFRLKRDGVLVDSFPARGQMNAQEIAALYAGDAQRRRLLETAAVLKLRALDAGRDVNAADYASEIERLLRTDTSFAFLASRNDFNLARARYRGWLDTVPPSLTEYELLAVNAQGEERRVGLLDIDPTQPQAVLPADDFEQVSQGDCDRIEAARDHYTVALSWRAPGTDPNDARLADALASQILVTGYDLYRDTENLPDNVTEPTLRDIAGEAAQVRASAAGRVDLAGLELVNDVLLPASGAPEGGPAFLETRDQLAAAGLRPGDRRTYYLVPRDFTGNYGPAVAEIVTVPNLTRPQVPWDVETYAVTGEAEDALEFSWSAVNLDNYLRENSGGRVFCDLERARETGIVDYVAPGQTCGVDVERSLRVDVTGYRVFRFSDFDTASRYLDADGDGFSDAAERNAGKPGAQCDFESPAPAGGGALLPPEQIDLQTVSLPNSGRQIVRFRDTVPAQTPGEVAWYRIASVASDGQISALSAPVRGMFPDRSLPDKGRMTITTRVSETCDCGFEAVDTNAPWGFADRFGTSDHVNLFCDGDPLGTVATRDLANPDSASCQALAQAVSDGKCADVSAVYPTSFGRLDDLRSSGSVCSASLPPATSLCSSGQVALVPRSCQTRVLALGEDSSGDAEIVYTPSRSSEECAEIFQTINGVSSVVASSCGQGGGAVDYTVSNETFCGYAQVRNDNAQGSKRTQIPCFTAADPDLTDPSAPQPVGLAFDDTRASIRWRLPSEPLSSTLIELTRDDGAELVLGSAPVQEAPPGGVHQFALDVPAVGAADERWCVRLRSVARAPAGQDAAQSGWTPPLCVSRDAALPPPEYLPWPIVPTAPRGEAIAAHIPFGNGSAEIAALSPQIELAAFGGLQKSCDVAQFNTGLYPRLACEPAGESAILTAAGEIPSFVVYRQARRPDGSEGALVQASPRIDGMHFEAAGSASAARFTRRANDPYLRVVQRNATADQYAIVFVDPAPLLAGYDYRYQLVFMSDDNRLLEWRETGWVSAPGLDGGAQAMSAFQTTGGQP